MGLDFKDELSKIFIGEIPDQFKDLSTISIQDIEEVFKKQQVDNVKRLNYAQLIEDILFLIKSKAPKPAQSFTEDNLLIHQYLNRIGLKTIYYKLIQNNAIGCHEKFTVAYFYRNLLQTATSIYGIEMLQGQESFIKELRSDETEYENRILEFNELMAAIDSNADHEATLELSEYWTYSLEQLNKLSELLYKSEFIDNAANFQQSFCNVSQSSCKWTKSQRSFMFLINLLSAETDTYKVKLKCEFLVRAFIFKDDEFKTAKTLQQTLRNIKPIIQYEPQFLMGDYKRLYDIYRLILP